ncbi:arsenic resistance protein [Salicibibacter cibarius]|uniref:Arsenic resistance protein n=1 Tax=Salicibibacter cibarius TaxID=2743000 RepID=A0A7T6Z2G8_9BACI|nr:bile acid:sodium symporter [Salicibibacter cibarius]QQK75578.1 arsenic resistance protein [Salicibibacter cibarius]
MGTLEKLQTFIILIAVGLGLSLGQIPIAEQYAALFVTPFLLLMLYGIFLGIPLHQIKSAFRNLTFLTANTIVNFIWTPLLAWGLGALFLADHPALWIGFIMLMVTPCTDWYLVFTGIAKGNVPLSTSVLPINLILQLLLLPVYLFIFAGTMEMVDVTTIVESVILVLTVPFVAACLTRYLLKNKKAFQKTWVPFFANGQIIFLSLAIMAMFASQGSYLFNNLELLFLLLIPILLFFIINYGIGRGISRILTFTYADAASFQLTIIARNSPISLAIALTAFPNEPLVALALVIGPLIELPLLAVISQLLLKRPPAKAGGFGHKCPRLKVAVQTEVR